jgi:hypothetical protein
VYICASSADENGTPGWKTLTLFLIAIVLVSLFPGSGQTSHPTHRIIVTFDYDFGVTPACSPTVKHGCVRQFNLYDISAGIKKRVKLGTIPVPDGATGFVEGISATTEPLQVKSGKHKLAVSAQTPYGIESDFGKCTIKVDVP